MILPCHDFCHRSGSLSLSTKTSSQYSTPSTYELPLRRYCMRLFLPTFCISSEPISMMLCNHKSFILPLKQPISVNAVYGGATVLPNTTPHGMQSSNGWLRVTNTCSRTGPDASWVPLKGADIRLRRTSSPISAYGSRRVYPPSK